MRYLFSSSNLNELRIFLRQRCLFAFDFDGTLAKIVDSRHEAGLQLRTAELIRQLNSKADVAVISGRGLLDLKQRMSGDIKYLVGNHGAEGPLGSSATLNRASEISRNWIEMLRTTFSEKGASWIRSNLLLSGLKKLPLDPKGIQIEDKNYTVSVHYRACKQREVAREILIHLTQQLNPKPRLVFGKWVINLIPSFLPHKGDCLLDLLKRTGLKSGFYIGDDDTDEDVFGLNQGLTRPREGIEAKSRRVFTVRVGKKAHSAALFYLKRQSEINRLLEFLLKYGT
jgi:trehalose 6-phosphate phosphatase